MFARFKHLMRSSPQVILVLLAGLLVVVANWSGVSWSWDSTDYVAAGRSIAKLKGSLDVSGLAMTVRPPGYPALIALGEVVGLPTNITLLTINVGSAAISALCVFTIVSHVASVKTAIFAATFTALTPTMLWQTSMAWSEPPFIAMLLVTMLVALRFTGRLRFFALGALYVSLFFLRFVGPVFIAPIALIAVVVDSRTRGWLRSFALHTGTVLAAALPMAWWLARNHRIDGTLTGARVPGGGSFWETVTHAVGTYGTFLTAQPFDSVIYERVTNYPFAAQVAGVLVLVSLGAAAVQLIMVAGHRPFLFSTRDLVMATNLMLIISYTAFSAYRFVHFELGRLDTRMMVPMLPPIVIVAALQTDGLVRRWSSVAKIAMTCVVVVTMAHGAISVKDAVQFGSNQRHLSGAVSRNLDLHKFVRTLEDDSALYSNAPQMLFPVADTWPIYTPWQVDQPWPTPCTHRYAVYYNDFQVQDNRPTIAPIIYEDPIGTVYDVGLCSEDINAAWD